MARSFCPVREDSALIIVDYQDAILKTFDQKIQDQLHRQTKLCIQMAQQLQLPIIVFEQYPKGLGATNEEMQLYSRFDDWNGTYQYGCSTPNSTCS